MNTGLCFKIENLFGAQFDELEKMYVKSHKKYYYEDLVMIIRS